MGVSQNTQEMNELINKNSPIVVDLDPIRNEVYSGIGLKSTEDVFIFICFNDETKEFDGFAIIRNYEIKQYREWDKLELKEIKKNNYSDFLEILPLDKMVNFYQCLKSLLDQKLIAIFTESDDDSYFVGKIEKLAKNELVLKLISQDGEWIENEIIVINEITYIGFGSSYENELLIKNSQIKL